METTTKQIATTLIGQYFKIFKGVKLTRIATTKKGAIRLETYGWTKEF